MAIADAATIARIVGGGVMRIGEADYIVQRGRKRFDKVTTTMASSSWRSGPAEKRTNMTSPKLGLRLRTSVGPEACDDLSNAFEEVQNDMLSPTTEPLDGRVNALGADLRTEIAKTEGRLRTDIVRADSNLRAEIAKTEGRLRLEMAEGFAGVRRDIVDMRVEVLRWAFAFWLGQFAATVGLLAFLLRPR
jgi:hypothetical protein